MHYVKVETESAGLAQDRYAIYLDNVEAAQNRLKASWEGLWQATLESDVLVDVYNSLAKILEALDEMGGLLEIIDKAMWVTQPLTQLSRGLGETLRKDFDEGKKSVEELRETVQETKPTYKEYIDNVKDAAKENGYLVDANGRLYKSIATGRGTFKQYIDDFRALTEVEYAAGVAADSFDKKLMNMQGNLNKAKEEVKTTAINFSDFLYGAMESAGEGSGFQQIGTNIANLNREFENGILTFSEYFEQLQLQLENMDMAEAFGENTEAAQTFFTGLAYNGTQALSMLSEQFDKGDITITEYSESLVELADVFQIVGDMSFSFIENLGLSEQAAGAITGTVTAALGEIGVATEQLRAMQELNIIVQDAYVQSVSDSLKFGTQAYNDYMQQIATAAAISGQSFVDLQGNALTSADQIYKFLTANTGNFKVFADQTASKTGQVVKSIVNNIGKLLTGLGEGIKNFKGEIKITPVQTGVMTFQGGFMGDVLNMLQIPQISLQVGTSGFNAGNMGQILSDIGSDLQGLDFDFDAGIYTNPAAIEGASQEYSNLADTIGSVANQFQNMDKAGKDAAKSAADAAKELANAIKDAKKEAIDSLKEQLKGYKKIIDARKKLLKSMEQERKYQQDLEDKQLNLSNIQSEIAELRLDDSEEAQARLRQLMEDEREAKQDIDDLQYERGIDLQTEALDAEYEKFADHIESLIRQIEAIDANSLGSFASQLAAILQTLASPGSGLKKDTGVGNDRFDLNRYHDGGWAGGVKSNEEIAKLLDGERIMSEADMNKLINVRIPEIADFAVKTSGMNIENLMSITVEGNLDKTVIPSIKEIARDVMNEINSGMIMRGFNRSANSFST